MFSQCVSGYLRQLTVHTHLFSSKCVVLRLVLVSYAKSSSTRGERKPRGFMVPSCKRQASSRARPELREDAEFSNRGALEGLPLLGLGSLVHTFITSWLLRNSRCTIASSGSSRFFFLPEVRGRPLSPALRDGALQGAAEHRRRE